jgi:hypothetical protein
MARGVDLGGEGFEFGNVGVLASGLCLGANVRYGGGVLVAFGF